jgi:hypothetical protein
MRAKAKAAEALGFRGLGGLFSHLWELATGNVRVFNFKRRPIYFFQCSMFFAELRAGFVEKFF